jgi:hypothetical protein
MWDSNSQPIFTEVREALKPILEKHMDAGICPRDLLALVSDEAYILTTSHTILKNIDKSRAEREALKEKMKEREEERS